LYNDKKSLNIKFGKELIEMIDRIERITNETRELVNKFFMENCFSTDMSIRGEIIDGTKLEGFLLQEDNKIIGLVTYTFFGDICEIVSLDSKKENIGIGSALVKEVEKVARDNDYKKIRLITTNDNMRALQFYQKRGYCLTKLYPNAMDEVRRVKPNVPELGDNDIPLRDEIELEKVL
jgi:ribosomal protein S18 acetylase RimI-like enzyme